MVYKVVSHNHATLFFFFLFFFFFESQADHSLIVYNKGPLFTALLVYVDDMIITGNGAACVTSLKSVLDQKFRIKDLGSLKYFFGFRNCKE